MDDKHSEGLDMQLRKVSQVERTSTLSTANDLLARGWDLFSVVPKSPADTMGVVFVLVQYEDQ
jgi:hypothetical protein